MKSVVGPTPCAVDHKHDTQQHEEHKAHEVAMVVLANAVEHPGLMTGEARVKAQANTHTHTIALNYIYIVSHAGQSSIMKVVGKFAGKLAGPELAQ